MDWEQIANVATALALALMSGISIGRRIPVRSDGKLAEAGKLLAQDAALGRGLRSAMERMRDQGRFTGPKVSQRADWDLALPEDSATYQLQLRRTPAPQSGGGSVMGYRKYDAQEVIERIAMCADRLAGLAGVGAMETAGAILGYLAKYPKDLEPFMVGGTSELPRDFILQQDLTRLNDQGEVIDPEHARRQIQINAMKKKSA